MAGSMFPGIPGMGDEDTPPPKPKKELTEEERRQEAIKKKEADAWAAHASANIPGTWRRLPDKNTPLTDEEIAAEEAAGSLSMDDTGRDSKLKPGVYRNDATGVDIRLKEDRSISFPSPIEYHKGTKIIKRGVIRTDEDFIKKYGGGINFMKKEEGAQVIYFDVGEALLSANRLKLLIAHAGKEPAADLEFGPKINAFIENLPHKEKDEINRMLIDLHKKHMLTSILRGTHTEQQDLVDAKNNIDGLTPVVTNKQALEVTEQQGPVGPGATLPLDIDETTNKVEEEIEKVNKHLMEGRLAIGELKSSLDSYNEILKSKPADLIKSPIPQEEARLLKDRQGPAKDFPSVFHQVEDASKQSESARKALLDKVETEIRQLNQSKDACKQTLDALRADQRIAQPAAAGTPAADEQKKLTDKITKLETKFDKMTTDIEALDKLRTDAKASHDALRGRMEDKRKDVNAIVAPQRPASPAPSA